MQTYAETLQYRLFDFNAFLVNKNVTMEEMHKAEDLAGAWTTCACGNQCAIIPRSNGGRPLDDKLAMLGAEFYSAVSSYYQKTRMAQEREASGLVRAEVIGYYKRSAEEGRLRAINTLAQIESRSAVLIAEIEAKKNKGK